ncbi:MAG: hypothetical protein R3C05_30135 [Pirellulaceae bacterium]
MKLSQRGGPLRRSLLQDMAIPLLLKELPTEYDVLLEVRETNKLRLSTRTRPIRVDHAEAAGVFGRENGICPKSLRG